MLQALDFKMERKHVVTILLLSLFGFAFFGMSENEMRKALAFFDTGWLDAVKAIFVGTLLGVVLRIEGVQNYLRGLTLDELWAGSAFWVLGLGFVAMGLVGASITYVRFGALELIRIPLHASVIGLSMCVIFISIRVLRSEKSNKLL